MKLACLPICLLVGALAGCGEPTDIVVPEREIRDFGGIELDRLSFSFPFGFKFAGAVETCPNQASDCPLADDSTHLVWRSGDLRFDYMLDLYGGVPMGPDWGDPITINGKPAFRKYLDNGATRYLITNHYGGAGSAAVAIWHEEEEPVFWGTCDSEKNCDTVLQTLASVSMRSAEQECRLLFPQPPKQWVPPPGYKPVNLPAPNAPRREPEDARPPPPPSPAATLPPGAEHVRQEYLDAK